MVHVQELMLMQPLEWRQKQLDDDDGDDDDGPVLQVKEPDAWPEWVDISDQSRELKTLLDKWNSLHINQETLYEVWELRDD